MGCFFSQLMKFYYFSQRFWAPALKARSVGHGMALVGHRGASATKPENTLTAIRQALDDGANGVEFDLQQMKDNSLIVLHDETLKRTASQPLSKVSSPAAYEQLLNTSVSKLVWEDVREVAVGGTQLSRFEEVLQEISKRPTAFCFAELKKTGGEKMVEEVVQTIKKQGIGPKQVVFISFNPSLCTALKQRLPAYDTLLIKLCASKSSAMAAIDEAQQLGLDGVDLHADACVVTREIVSSAHDRGLQVAVWVSRAPAANDTQWVWNAMHANGVDMFTSNLPREAHA